MIETGESGIGSKNIRGGSEDSECGTSNGSAGQSHHGGEYSGSHGGGDSSFAGQPPATNIHTHGHSRNTLHSGVPFWLNAISAFVMSGTAMTSWVIIVGIIPMILGFTPAVVPVVSPTARSWGRRCAGNDESVAEAHDENIPDGSSHC